MNKKIILGITVASAISIGVLSGCKSAAVTEQKNEDTVVSENVTDTENTDTTVSTNTTEGAAEEAFGLKDYEGFYYYKGTEEFEDYEIAYTYGYQFNGDGTGVSYVQDVIDFTWNETEIHFADRTEAFSMEPGKLIVGDFVYEKLEGNFIAPYACEVDAKDLADGIYHAYIAESGIDEANGQTTISTEILTEDAYDIVDINRMAEGDAIYINGQLLYVDSVEQTDSGIININGGIEEGGSALIAVDESNCFVYAGMDMERSYTSHGMAELAVSDELKLTDGSDPSEEKVYSGNDAVAVLKEMVSVCPLNCYNCTVTVENGEIVEINRLFRP